MDPLSLIPQPQAIQVNCGWFQFFLTLTFILHLLFMNAMLGSGIIALVKNIAGKPRDLSVAREISGKWPFTIAFAVNMGVAPLLFIQLLYGQFVYTSSVLMAAYWLSVVAMLLIAYCSAYLFNYRFDAGRASRMFFVSCTVVLLLIVAFLFSNNMTLMLSPEKWARYFDNPGGTLLNLSESMLVPRYLHFVTASVAVGGLFLALLAKFGRKNENTSENTTRGLKWFSYATIAQIPIGFWFFMTLDADAVSLFMGGGGFATALFVAGMAGTLLSILFGLKNMLMPCAGTAVAVIAVMVLMRDILRRVMLEPHFSISTLKVEPQYSPLIMFLVALAIGLSLVVYMLKLAAGSGKEAE